MYKNKKTVISPDDITAEAVQPLINEIDSILQDVLTTPIEYQIPEAMARHLRDNIYVFSGCKTYAELQSASAMLADEYGNIKPFSRYFKEVQQVHDEYNKSYLKSEYQFAVQSATMAGKWADIDADGDEFNLQYRTANDDRVRYSHQMLHDVTLPPSDPFWDKYFPPNGWRCRCTAVQVRKGKYEVTNQNEALERGEKATYTQGKGGVNTSAMFRFNPGKQQVIFPEHHPYFRGESKVVNAVQQLAKAKDYKIVKQDKEIRAEIARILEYPERFGQIATELNDVQKAAIMHYTGNGYDELNRLLGRFKTAGIFKDKEYLRSYAQVLEDALTVKQPKYIGEVYRGVDLPKSQIDRYVKAHKSGRALKGTIFQSTTSVPTEAFDGNVKFIIKSKTGVRIDDLSYHTSEKEVLLKPSAQFKVKDVVIKNTINGREKTVIELEEL